MDNITMAERCEAAHDLLVRNGWCTGQLRDSEGRHCINGALLSVNNGGGWGRLYGGDLSYDIGRIFDLDPIGQELAGMLPEEFQGLECSVWGKLARWNNTRNSVEPVLDLLTRAAKELRNRG